MTNELEVWLDDAMLGAQPRRASVLDLNPSLDKSEHAPAIDETDPRPSLETLRSTARFYRVTDAQAAKIETDLRAAVGTWRTFGDSLALSTDDRDLLASVLEPS